MILLFLVFSSYKVLLHTMHDLAIFRIKPTQRPSATVSFSSSGTRFVSLNISSVSTIVVEGFVLRNLTSSNTLTLRSVKMYVFPLLTASIASSHNVTYFMGCFYLCPGRRPKAQVIKCVGFFFLYYVSSARKWTNCTIVPMRPMRPSCLNEDLKRRH